MAFHPYLNFGGNCREAFTRYREIFGGELTLLAMSDMPPGNEAPADQADLIMHAALTFDDHVLMASDDPSGRFDGVRGMFVNYSVGDVNEAERVFEALAEGGEVTMPRRCGLRDSACASTVSARRGWSTQKRRGWTPDDGEFSARLVELGGGPLAVLATK